MWLIKVVNSSVHCHDRDHNHNHYHNHDQHKLSSEQLSNHVFLREQLNRVCKNARLAATASQKKGSSRWSTTVFTAMTTTTTITTITTNANCQMSNCPTMIFFTWATGYGLQNCPSSSNCVSKTTLPQSRPTHIVKWATVQPCFFYVSNWIGFAKSLSLFSSANNSLSGMYVVSSSEPMPVSLLSHQQTTY